MPEWVSAMRGTGLPIRFLGVTLFVTSAPSLPRSIASAYSYAKQPEAGMTGFLRTSEPMRTLRSTLLSAKLHLPRNGSNGKYGSLAADATEYLACVLVEKTHAGEA